MSYTRYSSEGHRLTTFTYNYQVDNTTISLGSSGNVRYTLSSTVYPTIVGSLDYWAYEAYMAVGGSITISDAVTVNMHRSFDGGTTYTYVSTIIMPVVGSGSFFTACALFSTIAGSNMAIGMELKTGVSQIFATRRAYLIYCRARPSISTIDVIKQTKIINTIMPSDAWNCNSTYGVYILDSDNTIMYNKSTMIETYGPNDNSYLMMGAEYYSCANTIIYYANKTSFETYRMCCPATIDIALRRKKYFNYQ